MAWPQLMFILATNIQTKSAVIKLCANSAVVVTLSNLIDVLLVQRMSSWLVKIHQHGVVANPVRVNQLKAESQYILLVYSNLVFPVLAQFLLDVSAPRITCLYCGTQLDQLHASTVVQENCMRYYLYFSNDLHELMKYWNIAQVSASVLALAADCVEMTRWLQTGSSGFRLGFCLPKLLTQFAPVWHMRCFACLSCQ